MLYPHIMRCVLPITGRLNNTSGKVTDMFLIAQAVNVKREGICHFPDFLSNLVRWWSKSLPQSNALLSFSLVKCKAANGRSLFTY